MKPAKSSLDLPVLEGRIHPSGADAGDAPAALRTHRAQNRQPAAPGIAPASLNLRTASFEPTRKETAVIDPNMVEATPLGKNPWKGEDFEDEPDQMEESAGVDIQTVAEEQKAWCREQDLNLHAFWAQHPKCCVSASSTIPAREASQ